MTQEQQMDLQKRVEEAKAYCRTVFQFAWEPRLQADQYKIEAVDAFVDYKYEKDETKGNEGAIPSEETGENLQDGGIRENSEESK